MLTVGDEDSGVGNASHPLFDLVKQKEKSGGELLEIWLLDNHLLDTFGRKSTARHKIYQLLESGWAGINWIRTVDTSF
jgi:hypothetical protein